MSTCTPENLWREKREKGERVWSVYGTHCVGVSSIAKQHGLIGGKQRISGECIAIIG